VATRLVWLMCSVAVASLVVSGCSGGPAPTVHSADHVTSPTVGNEGAVGVTTATSGQGFSGDGAHPPAADVVVSSCKYDSVMGGVRAQLTITNHSSEKDEYIVQLQVFDGAGVMVTQEIPASVILKPGQATKTEGMGFMSGAAPSGLTCRVADVQRLFAGN
jgi:hypothetical protein